MRKLPETIGRWIRNASTPVVALACLMAAAPAAAQNPGCDRLQAQIASMSRGNPGEANKYIQAAQKQRGELERTSAYANSLGCANRKFLIFGSAPPPQCGEIEGQMQRMRANLGQLQAKADAAGGGNEIAVRDLTFRYNAQCRAPQRQATGRTPGLLESIFGANQPQQLEQIPLDPGPEKRSEREAEAETDAPRRGGAKAVCVRTCDGGFFPVSYSARRAGLEGLGDLCHALCPNTEAKLYTMSTGGDIEEAVSPEGDAYADLPNAFKFQKSFDPTCTCKTKGQSWVEVLAEAERVLGRSGTNDIVVTPQKADELARPSQTPRPNSKSKRAASQAPEITKTLAPPENTASIAADAPVDDAQYREITAADGVKRRLRIVGPK